MNRLIKDNTMVNKTIKTYLCISSNTANKSYVVNGITNKNQINFCGGPLSSSQQQRSYTTYNFKTYPFYHETKVSHDLMDQKKMKFQIASSHINNGDGYNNKSDYYKHRKYHNKNEFKHHNSLDNKPIFQHIEKHNEKMKTVGELKEDYRRLVEESKRTAPKIEHIRGQDKMKDFSLGVD
ncbi:hypothetical protein RB653_010008 [Dictyostelium firmibasis]|uniref:Uncharacterized protein n=1 Tax=Dictyostelium firmibasis TaxID=79012 RepID=A0AAN7TYL3_9MYCE